MDEVKLEPLIDGQRAEDRVIEHLAGSERLRASRRGSSRRARSRRTASTTASRSSSPVGMMCFGACAPVGK